MEWWPLQLFALAYNLANFLRRLVLPRSVKHWSLTTLREKLIKIGAKVVRHAKYVTFQMSEVAVPRELFPAIRDRIQQFGGPLSVTTVLPGPDPSPKHERGVRPPVKDESTCYCARRFAMCGLSSIVFRDL